MPIIKSADAPTFHLPGTVFTGLASPSRGSSTTAVWRVRLAAGTSGAAHRLTHEEIFVCIAGHGSVRIGLETHEVSAGDAIIVPPDTDLALANLGTVDFHAIAVFPVGGMAVLADQPPFTPPWAA